MKKYFLLLLFVSITSQAKTPIKVPVSFQEALSPTDTTSSTRFQNEYEFALNLGKSLTREKLTKCGYEIVESKEFYNASDILEAKERAAKAEASGAWLIVAPRRSNHYLLTAQGAPNTASVSLMANAKEVFSLAPIHKTLGVSNDELAKALLVATKTYKAKNYVTVVASDCVTCVDLSGSFDKAAKNLMKLKEIKFVGESPDLGKLLAELGDLKPDFVLLPNYSKTSAAIMAAFKSKVPKAIYLGGDGWGNSSFGFIQSATELEGVIGYTARGSIPVSDALKSFPLGKAVLGQKTSEAFPDSNSALSILRIIEATADLLCKTKPKDKAGFTKAFSSAAKNAYSAPWGVGVYKLTGRDFEFYKVIK